MKFPSPTRSAMKMPAPPERRSLAIGQQGLSLIELMVALTLGLLLTGLVIQVFSSQRQTYTVSQSLARVQEGNRFTADLIREPARVASQRGFCGGNAVIRNHIDAVQETVLANPALTVAGWRFQDMRDGDDFTVPEQRTAGAGNWSGRNLGGLPGPIADRVLPFSDVLLIREMRKVDRVWPLAVTPTQAAFTLNQLPAAQDVIPQCAVVLLTNCVNSDFFRNTSSDPISLARGQANCAPANLNRNWTAPYADDAHVYHVISHFFFIGLNVVDEPSLYRGRYDGNQYIFEEIVDGVEFLRVSFGYSNEPSGGRAVTGWHGGDQLPLVDGDADWGGVIAVRLEAASRGRQQLAGGRTAVQFELADGAAVTFPTDARLRQPLSGTIALRNRMIVQDD